MAAIRLHNTTPPLLRNLLNQVPWGLEQHPRLDELDRLLEALARRLDDAHGVLVGQRSVADVVCLVDVAVEAAVVESDVDVDNVAVGERARVGDAVADDLVDGCAHGLGEAVVVER